MSQLIVKSSYTLASKKASETIAKQCDCIKPTKQAKEHFKRKPF